jgi:hypothetical protein
MISLEWLYLNALKFSIMHLLQEETVFISRLFARILLHFDCKISMLTNHKAQKLYKFLELANIIVFKK